MENFPKKILIVDNDQGVMNSFENTLQKYDVKIEKAKDWEAALYLFNNQRFDLAILSLKLDGMSGLTLIQKWRNHEVVQKRDTAFIISMGQETNKTDKALITEMGDVGMIFKPFSFPILLSVIGSTMDKQKIRGRLKEVEQEKIDPLLRTNKLDKAAEAAKNLLEPLGEKGKFLSASIHNRAKFYDHSAGVLTGLLQEDPSNMSYTNELAVSLMAQGKKQEALAQFEKADQYAPANIERVNTLAGLYLELKDPDKSISKMKESMELNPDTPDLKFSFFEKLQDAGFSQHAQDFCKETSTPHELIRYYNNRGVMLSQTGNHQAAIDQYVKAAKLIPGAKEIYKIFYNKALAHIKLKTQDDLKAAESDLQKVLSMKADFAKAKEMLELVNKYITKTA